MTDKSLRKFAIISVVLFLSVMCIGLYVIVNKHLCDSIGDCELISSKFIELLIIMIAAIGMTYGFLVIKQFDNKLDKEVINNYKELLDYNKENKNEKNNKVLSF